MREIHLKPQRTTTMTNKKAHQLHWWSKYRMLATREMGCSRTWVGPSRKTFLLTSNVESYEQEPSYRRVSTSRTRWKINTEATSFTTTNAETNIAKNATPEKQEDGKVNVQRIMLEETKIHGSINIPWKPSTQKQKDQTSRYWRRITTIVRNEG